MTVGAPPGRRLGPAFGRLWGVSLGSNLADGFGATAAPLLAATLTRDPLLVSLLGVAQYLPWLLFGVLSGSVVDGFDRRRVAAVACGVRAVVAGAVCLLVATDHMIIAMLIAMMFVFGVLETVADGSVQAMVPSVVERSRLVRANSRIQSTEVVAQTFVAAPLAGVLFAVAAALPFLIHSASFALAAVLVITLPLSAARAADRYAEGGDAAGGEVEPGSARRLAGLAEGVRFLVAHRLLRDLWIVNIVLGVFVMVAQAVLVLFVLDVLDLPEALYGVFVMTAAVGAVAGALAAPRLVGHLGRGWMLIGSVGVTSAGFAICGLAPHVVVAGVGFLLVGLGVAAWNVVAVTLRQELVPGHLLGRVHGAWRSLGWGLMPLGTLAGGLLGRIDLRLPMIVGAIGIALAGVVFRRSLLVLPRSD
ncbi:MFS transporter [Jiangella asiatica]|uniref:MFS transporter n=1 Tax=Jiangella asiatica TaxID=2530372 RepID=A0A4R5D6C1_9ACTN|nr:MFS transporter [Jiangella asiatica]TDE09052.1 MFS transporter [Jiangella asiatica]